MFNFSYNPDAIILQLQPEKRGLISALFSRGAKRDLTKLSLADRETALAIADLRATSEDIGGGLEVRTDRIELSHSLASAVSGATADALGMPRLTSMMLKTDAEGVLGSSSFKLRYEWWKNGRREVVNRVGSIIETSEGVQRLPMWLMEAIETADSLGRGGDDVAHWAALGRFRQALDPGVRVGDPDLAARVSMTDFLSDLEVRVADRFGISPNLAGDDFEVIPFSAKSLDEASDSGDDIISESQGELTGAGLKDFQSRIRERGAVPAYRLSRGSFLVVDRSALTALQVMTEVQKTGSVDERADFVRNPRARITAALESQLRGMGKLNGLTPQAEEEAVEVVAGPLFVETKEFSERVRGIKAFEKSLEIIAGSGTTWLPEGFERALSRALAAAPTQDVVQLKESLREAVDKKIDNVEFSGVPIPASPEMVEVVSGYVASRKEIEGIENSDNEKVRSKAIVLDSEENFNELRWSAGLKARHAFSPSSLPTTVKTQLKSHQVKSFEWQIDAWKSGLPGVLNADEPGLGKTLQTISFLVWLKSQMAQAGAAERGPVLVVAPTSLLENWEAEVARHVAEPGLGHLIRLFGSATSSRKFSGARGMDIENGEAKLDLGFLHEAIQEGRAHRFWILTTYTTLTNYQHSLGRIRFSAAVFDEIQNLKNPDSLRAHAARAMNVDFRIGLTGTPIENSTEDLWAVLDQIAPGALGSLKEFRSRYSVPDDNNMEELYSRIFDKVDGRPPLGIRRLKEDVAKDLPAKTRRLHPRLMPNLQADVYEVARTKLAKGGLGAALKMLHHIRSVSVHPSLEDVSSDDTFIVSSARLQATFDILRKIKSKGERCLVFIEHRKMQYRFIELAKSEFGLDKIDLINGDTPIPQRQAIVDRFQRHLAIDGGFDLLVLGPKAAGVGLTLTAATHVIHLSRWWNPAVEEQCNDRVHRIGQTRAVTVHVPMAIHPGYREGSFDCLLHSLMQRKRRLASSALWPMGDTQGDSAELRKMLEGSQENKTSGDPVRTAMEAMFARDGIGSPTFEADGAVVFS